MGLAVELGDAGVNLLTDSETFRTLIATLARQTVRHQVIVADDGSTDDTAEQIRSHHPEVRLVQMHENLPLSVASNRAAATGDGEVIVWLNNDVVLRLQVDDNPEPIKELRRLVERAARQRR